MDGTLYPVSVKGERDELLGTIPSEKLRKSGREEIKAPMPGLVVEVEVEEGEVVAQGSGLVIIEAMKMENELKSPLDGIVKEVRVQKGDTVEREHVLIVLE